MEPEAIKQTVDIPTDVAQPDQKKPTIVTAPIGERRNLIFKIIQYSTNFPKVFDQFKIDLTNIETLEEEELKKTLDHVRCSISCDRCTRAFVKTSYIGFHMIEGIATKLTPLRIKGFADVMNSDEGVNDTIKEIAIEYGDMTYINPFYRLGLMTMQTMAEMHFSKDINLDKPVSAEAIKKFDKL